jgi:hypothetical protein
VQEPIKIDGLREFQRSLKAIDKDLPKALRLVLNAVVQIVIDDAQPLIPRRTGRAAASLKAQSTQTKARISAGGTRAPWFPWLDFGGRREGRGHGVAVRPFLTQGRYVWLSYANRRDDVTEAANKGLADLAEQAGLELS